MLIMGCDFHTRYQQIAMMDTDTGEAGGQSECWCCRSCQSSRSSRFYSVVSESAAVTQELQENRWGRSQSSLRPLGA